jgi:transcription termination factor NusB
MEKIRPRFSMTDEEVEEMFKTYEEPTRKWLLQRHEEDYYSLGDHLHTFILANFQVVSMAYLVKDTIEHLIKTHEKLSFDEANCYHSCFYLCRELLRGVDEKYLHYHEELREFYREDRELSNNWDRLSWVEKGQVRLSEFEILRRNIR